MRIEQFEVVIACAQTKSMPRAAEILNTTIQNVSKIVKQLESELNVRIFVRSKNGLILTADGDEIYKNSKLIVDCVNQMKSKYIPEYVPYKLAMSSEKISILSEQALGDLCGNALEEICMKHDMEKAIFVTKDASEINSEIERDYKALFDEYDVVITNVMLQDMLKWKKSFSNCMAMYHLTDNRLGIRINEKHPFAKLSEVSLKEVVKQNLILPVPDLKKSSQMQIVIESLGVPLTPKYIVNSPLKASEYIQKNLGYSFVTYDSNTLKERIFPGTILVPLAEDIIISHVCLVNEAFGSSKIFQDFLAILNSVFLKMYRV